MGRPEGSGVRKTRPRPARAPAEASRAPGGVWSPLREVLPQSQGARLTSPEPGRSGAPCWEDRQRPAGKG